MLVHSHNHGSIHWILFFYSSILNTRYNDNFSALTVPAFGRTYADFAFQYNIVVSSRGLSLAATVFEPENPICIY